MARQAPESVTAQGDAKSKSYQKIMHPGE